MKHDRHDAPFWTEMRWLVPVATAILLMPPLLGLFDGTRVWLGLPALPVYIFAIWAIAIVLCRATARRLSPPRPRPEDVGP